MASFFNEIFTTLTTPPGSLAYHIVIAFSVAGALPLAVANLYTSGFPQSRRMLLGLLLLLAGQFLLFLSVGFSWQDVIISPLLLPILDRAVAALSLILIIWLWAFPEPLRMADAATFLLALLVLIISAFSALFWINQGSITSYNGSLPDLLWGAVNLLLILLGGFLLFMRRPNSMGVALAMLLLLFLGHLTHLLAPLAGSHLPGAVRLAQVAAYPLLLTLPQRFQAPVISPGPVDSSPAAQNSVEVASGLFQSFLDLASVAPEGEYCRALTQALSQVFSADLCLLVSLPEQGGPLSIQCGYDLSRATSLEGADLDERLTPMLAAALRRCATLRLPASSTSSDLKGLSQAFNLARSGPFLAVPFPSSDQEHFSGVVLLSPYSNRGWTKEDEAHLAKLAANLAESHERSGQLVSLQDQFDQASQHNQQLQSELSSLQSQASQAERRIESLVALVASQAEEPARDSSTFRPTPGQAAPAPESSHLEDELRLALEELAYTRNALARADQKILVMEKDGTLPQLPLEQRAALATAVHQLRQPLASILGYSDLLLAESAGILGAVQRKFLQRITASTRRMDTQLGELLRYASLDPAASGLAPTSLDFAALIDESLCSISSLIEEKDLSLQVDLPADLPPLVADRDAISQVLAYLLHNACSVTSPGGQVSLRASLESASADQGYLLLQVSDQGGGIPPEDIPRLFSRLYREDNPPIPGLGETGVGLSFARTIVEAHQGRIWVDSEIGSGSTFSLLLPTGDLATPPEPASS